MVDTPMTKDTRWRWQRPIKYSEELIGEGESHGETRQRCSDEAEK